MARDEHALRVRDLSEAIAAPVGLVPWSDRRDTAAFTLEPRELAIAESAYFAMLARYRSHGIAIGDRPFQFAILNPDGAAVGHLMVIEATDQVTNRPLLVIDIRGGAAIAPLGGAAEIVSNMSNAVLARLDRRTAHAIEVVGVINNSSWFDDDQATRALICERSVALMGHALRHDDTVRLLRHAIDASDGQLDGLDWYDGYLSTDYDQIDDDEFVAPEVREAVEPYTAMVRSLDLRTADDYLDASIVIDGRVLPIGSALAAQYGVVFSLGRNRGLSTEASYSLDRSATKDQARGCVAAFEALLKCNALEYAELCGEDPIVHSVRPDVELTSVNRMTLRAIQSKLGLGAFFSGAFFYVGASVALTDNPLILPAMSVVGAGLVAFLSEGHSQYRKATGRDTKHD